MLLKNGASKTIFMTSCCFLCRDRPKAIALVTWYQFTVDKYTLYKNYDVDKYTIYKNYDVDKYTIY